jgi:hypothetical protein
VEVKGVEDKGEVSNDNSEHDIDDDEKFDHERYHIKSS